jgi:hypothetical protein
LCQFTDMTRIFTPCAIDRWNSALQSRFRRLLGCPQTQLRLVEFGFGESRFCIVVSRLASVT